LNRFESDGVQDDIDATGLLGHAGRVVLDSIFVERIDLRSLSRSACRHNILGERLYWREVAATQENLCAFTGEGSSHTAADGTSGAVNERDFIFQQHRLLP
jgi:hypothetical protein